MTSRYALGAERLQVAVGERDDLDVDVGVVDAQRLDAHLVVLAEPALLRLLVAERRRGVPGLPRHDRAVLDEGPDDAGRALGTQRDAAAALVLEVVHLLGDDVGALAHAQEDAEVLEHRRVHHAVAVLAGDAGEGREQCRPAGRLGRAARRGSRSGPRTAWGRGMVQTRRASVPGRPRGYRQEQPARRLRTVRGAMTTDVTPAAIDPTIATRSPRPAGRLAVARQRSTSSCCSSSASPPSSTDSTAGSSRSHSPRSASRSTSQPEPDVDLAHVHLPRRAPRAVHHPAGPTRSAASSSSSSRSPATWSPPRPPPWRPRIETFVAAQFVARLFLNAEHALVLTLAAEELPARVAGLRVRLPRHAARPRVRDRLARLRRHLRAQRHRLAVDVRPQPPAAVRDRVAAPAPARVEAVRGGPRLRSARAELASDLRGPDQEVADPAVHAPRSCSSSPPTPACSPSTSSRRIGACRPPRRTSCSSLAGLPGIPVMLVAGNLSDRYGRRVVGCTFAIVSAASVPSASSGCPDGIPVLYVCMTVMLAGQLGAGPVLATYATELFPTALRGQAGSWGKVAAVAGQAASFGIGGVAHHRHRRPARCGDAADARPARRGGPLRHRSSPTPTAVSSRRPATRHRSVRR